MKRRHHLRGRKVIAMLPLRAILINSARSALPDEATPIAALGCDHLRAAGLDVFRQDPLPVRRPLLHCPRLVFSPPIAGTTAEALERTGLEVARKALSALRGI
jgi:D-3-phosphoglycerate dehydrogenase